MKPKKVSFSLLAGWQDQIVLDSLKWAKHIKNIKDENRLLAFEAGLRQGMTELIATLRRQNIIEEKYNE